MDDHFTPLIRRLFLGLFLAGMVTLGFIVLRLFLVPVAWAVILAYVTWPLYRHLRQALGGSSTWSALLMTLILTAAFVLPLLWLIALLRDDLINAYQIVAAYLENPQPLADSIARIPWLGEWLQEYLNRFTGDPARLRAELAQWGEQSIDTLGGLIGDLGRNTLKFAFALLTVFFLYRDGENALAQVRVVLRRFLGERGNAYLAAVGATTKAVVYGLVLTALAQGLLAGVGYWAAGVRAAVLLGAVTALVALIPFGTPLVWGSIGVSLLFDGRILAGIGLLLWGALVVSWIDNLIRPLVISSATRIPFILVMFGVLGGLAAFGLVGLFVGPVILAVLMAVWREWLEEQTPGPAVN
jgi:predicted PurR-regulated permease PerM